MTLQNLKLSDDKADGNNTDNELKNIDLMFGELGKKFHPEMKNEAFALMHLVPYLIHKAEEQGRPKDIIRGFFPNARKVCSQSSFIKYTQDWPRGVAGDFKIINMIMDRQEDARPDSFGSILGNFILCSAIAQQHREKVKIQSNLIKETCQRVKSPHIVSIACGSSRDMEEAQREIKESGARITLVDFDQDALDDSMCRLKNIQDQVETMQIDLRKLTKIFKTLVAKEGKFDLVYMGGLFDYFQTRLIRLVFKSFSGEFMEKNGKLMFTNIADGNPFRAWLEILANWVLIERTKEEMEDLLALVKFTEKKLYKDPTGLAWIAVASY